ncbi:uncharacterized protein TM35_000084290 [Trypanosoma theileri]|uniref:Uncharacterized protein n=1 Tax=Trypanosoma theileri TaxID=67003 RepID=A0A1X0P1D1_9TRYP|nr:uncharacterized protein TM35_000084290 [Trypanosoma theileri]ORC90631.1 hypothetical protein TM35_000084290 [Trypanosoma theileri]
MYRESQSQANYKATRKAGEWAVCERQEGEYGHPTMTPQRNYPRLRRRTDSEKKRGSSRKKGKRYAQPMSSRSADASSAMPSARFHSEPESTRYVHVDSDTYLTRVDQMGSTPLPLYTHFKADNRSTSRDELCRANNESECFLQKKYSSEANCEDGEQAYAELTRWEETSEGADYDKAKPKYDAELGPWNASKPKDEHHAKEVEVKIVEYNTDEYEGEDAEDYYLDKLLQTTVQNLKSHIQRQNKKAQTPLGVEQEQEEMICALKRVLEQQDQVIFTLERELEEQDQVISALQMKMETHEQVLYVLMEINDELG